LSRAALQHKIEDSGSEGSNLAPIYKDGLSDHRSSSQSKTNKVAKTALNSASEEVKLLPKGTR